MTSIRYASNVPTEDPKKKAQSIVDALPGNSLASKTAILSAGAGVSVWAISNELYVVNEETVVAFCLLSVFYGIFRYGGPMYKEWADNQVQKIKDLLYEARTNHAASVKERIEDVKPLNNVVEITKQLFDVSKVGIRHKPSFRITDKDTGDCQTRSTSFRTRTKDRVGRRSQDCLGFLGAIRGTGQAATTEGIGR